MPQIKQSSPGPSHLKGKKKKKKLSQVENTS